jgi:hypothetical protein
LNHLVYFKIQQEQEIIFLGNDVDVGTLSYWVRSGGQDASEMFLVLEDRQEGEKISTKYKPIFYSVYYSRSQNE